MKCLDLLNSPAFGRLTVLRENGRDKGRNRLWLCKCICGKEITVPGTRLTGGRSRSCGCLRNDLLVDRTRTHGKTYTPAWNSWDAMITRCTRPGAINYADYGGRGIRVCERWLSFENFFADMGERTEGTTLDRKDVNGNYEPGNCRWAPDSVQANNKRSNHFVEFGGRKQTIKQWADERGMGWTTLDERLRRRWTVERALNDAIQPVRK